MPLVESKTMTCRDKHFIGVVATKEGITIAHRHMDSRDFQDSDDLHFDEKNAELLLFRLKEAIEGKGEIVEESGKLSVRLSDDKKEIGMHPSDKNWIGLDKKTAKIFLVQLEEKLKMYQSKRRRGGE